MDEKTCSKCGETKPKSEFYPYAGRACKRCVGARTRRYTLAHPEQFSKAQEKYRNGNRIVREWGITREQYDAMLTAQGHRCAICRSTEPRGKGRFHVDHDHETGVIRGLLCHGCNTALGLLKDKPEVVDAAAAYLRAPRPNAPRPENVYGIAA